MSKVVLITGCSSGIGLTTAVLLAEKGNKVYATMRNTASCDRLEKAATEAGVKAEILQLDVTDDASVNKAVDTVIEKEGQIDVLINNAGYGLRGPAETVRIEEAKEEFEVNFFGLLRTTQAVLPHMRKQKSGHIINISSIAGIRAKPDSDLYNASKFAVEGLSEAMAPPLAEFNIKVTLIEPGPVDTDFTGRSIKRGTRLDGKENPYKKTIDIMQALLKKMFENAQHPEEVAELINTVINTERPHLRYQTSEKVKALVEADRKDATGYISFSESYNLLNQTTPS